MVTFTSHPQTLPMLKNLRHSREDHLHKPGKVVVRVSIPVAHQIGQVIDSRSRRELSPSGSDQKDNHVAKTGEFCQVLMLYFDLVCRDIRKLPQA